MVAEMSERFYINLPLAKGPVELTGAEAHHLATVCRLRAGDAVCLFNGDGREYVASIRAVAKKTVLLEIVGIDALQRELPFVLEVAAPLPKGDRGTFLVEKLTELGVTSFVVLSSERSVVHPREGKLDKLHRHVIEASKQCGRNRLMRTAGPEPWSSYCRGAPPATVCLLAHPRGTNRVCSTAQVTRPESSKGVPPVPPESLQYMVDAPVTDSSEVRLAVGPEGGFTESEVAMASATGWHLVDLGPRILRIETAALALAVAVITQLSRPGAPRA
jgi:16S rRNA (uracil1498-N3)-methyltransferase